jgi:hypothetical protein
MSDDLSQIPTDQLLQMLQSHPAVQQPQGQPDFLHNKTFANTASEAYGAASPLLGLNSMLDHAMYGGAGLLASAGGLAPNPVSDWLMDKAKSGDKVADAIKKWKDDYRARSGQNGFDWFELAGNVASPVNKLFPAATSLPEAVGQGAAYGAMQPTQGGDMGQKLVNTGLGGAGGALGYGVGKGVEALTSKAPEAAPTIDELRTTANAAYKGAKDAGIIVDKTSFGDAVKAMRDKAVDEGLDPILTPMSNRAIERLQEVQGDHITLDGIERLRRIIGMAAGGPTRDDRRIAYQMKDALDDYVEGLTSKDLVGGDESKIPLLQTARDAWSRMRKGETVENLIGRAETRSSQFSGSGFENALRTEFRNFAMNDKKMRGLSAEEQDAIRKVAEGGPVADVMRFVGKFAPRGVVSATLAHSLGGYGLPIAGEAGRQVATYATARNARLASELMRRGVPAVSTPAPYNDLVSALLQSSGRAGAIPAGRALTDSFAGTPIGP